MPAHGDSVGRNQPSAWPSEAQCPWHTGRLVPLIDLVLALKIPELLCPKWARFRMLGLWLSPVAIDHRKFLDISETNSITIEGPKDSLTYSQAHIHGQWMLPSLMHGFIGQSSIRDLCPPAYQFVITGHTHTNTHTNIYIYIHICTHTHVYIHMYTYAYICIYIYRHKFIYI